MAGVMTVGDEGMEVKRQSVPDIGGSGTAEIVASAHVSSEFRAEGVSYPETPGVGPFPAGTAMSDSTPNDDVN